MEATAHSNCQNNLPLRILQTDPCTGFIQPNCTEDAIEFTKESRNNRKHCSNICHQINNKRECSIGLMSPNKIHQYIYKTSRTKFSIFLLILIGVIALRTTCAHPVTQPGQRLILHTTRARVAKHQTLLREQRSLLQPTPPLHIRRRSAEMELKNCSSCQHFHQAYKQSIKTFGVLKDLMTDFAKDKQNITAKEYDHQWELRNITVKHRYHKYAENHTMDETLTFGKPKLIEEVAREKNLIVHNVTVNHPNHEYTEYNCTPDTKKIMQELRDSIMEWFAEIRDNYDKYSPSNLPEKYLGARHHIGYDVGYWMRIPYANATPVNMTSSDKDVYFFKTMKEHIKMMRYIRVIHSYFLCKDHRPQQLNAEDWEIFKR